MDAGRVWRGGQNQVRLLCRELAHEPGVAQRLVTRRNTPLATAVAAVGVPVASCSWTISLDPRALLRLVGELRSFRPHIVHAHDSHALFLALLARRLVADCAAPRPRVIGSRRVDFPVRTTSSWHRVDHVIAVSGRVKAVLASGGLPADRVTVVHSGIDPVELRRATTALGVRAWLGLPSATPVAVNVGALVDQKDQATLVRAAAAARPEAPSLHWVIAGEGHRRPALERLTRELGVADRVHLLGHVENVPALLAEASIFVQSSAGEGLPNAAVEALALGKPVVATRAGGTPELLGEGHLVDVGDAEALARKVVIMLRHPPAPTPLPPQFTAAAMARGVLAVYRSLL